MNGTTIVGIVVMFVGGLLISDYKGMGMKDPAIGEPCRGRFGNHLVRHAQGRDWERD